MNRPVLGRLGRNALLSSGGLGIRAVLQGAYLILLSRWMGPEGYGYFGGSIATAVVVGPLAGWGVSYLLSARVGRDTSTLGAMWATALFQVFLSGGLLILAVLLVSAVFLAQHVSMPAMLLLGIAELVALPVSNLAATASLAMEQGGRGALATCLVPAGRVAAASAAMLFGLAGTPDQVAAVHAAGSVTAALCAVWLVAGIGGRPMWRKRTPVAEISREGAPYAVGTFLGTSYMEVDKLLMLQILGAGAVGIYTAAFRTASIFTLPIAALLGVALPRLYATNELPEGLRLRRALARAILAYSCAAVLCIVLVAPLMPSIFGAGFSGSRHYVVMLCAWILPFGVHQYSAAILSTSGGQSARAGIEAAGFVAVVALNLLLMPSTGATAAIWALLAGELLMACACCAALRLRGKT